MSEKTYEMMWDCEYCGTKKLLGKTHRFCAECGAAQNPEKRYFPPDNEKVAVEDHQYVGADVHCPACQETQSAAVKHCANCGSPMQGGAAAHTQAEQVVGPDGQVQQAAAPGAPNQGAPEGGKKSSKVGCIIAAVGTVILCLILLVVANSFMTSAAMLEVTELTWRREIKIEKFDDVQESGDCDGMPKKAKLVKKTKPKEVCKKRKVDQGDGTFKEKKECKTPAPKCTYRVSKWTAHKTVKEEGGVDDEPKWPKTNVSKKKKKKALIGDKAEGDRIESYIVKFENSDSGDDHECVFSSASKWKKFEKGSEWAGETGMIAGDLKCDSLKAK